MRFVDLFAGLGGFHQALARLDHTCVFASELNGDLRAIYRRNFPDSRDVVVAGDIRAARKDVPPHEVLCAGFPCQPFSKSGFQKGVRDKTRGTLFHEIVEVLRSHMPPYVLLENVGNFARHDSGKTWSIVRETLESLGYHVRGTEHNSPRSPRDWRDRGHPRPLPLRRSSKFRESSALNGSGHGLISPHHLGFPHTRPRFFIVATLDPLAESPFPEAAVGTPTSVETILDEERSLTASDRIETQLTDQQTRCIDHWNEFLDLIPEDMEVPSFPIWADELDAKYPFEGRTPWSVRPGELAKAIPGRRFPPYTRRAVLMDLVPSYAREEVTAFRPWKVDFIRKNREWLRQARPHLPDEWVERLRAFPSSLRKLEWNARGGERDLWKYMLQFRPSGLRAKRFTTCPALVAMTATQIPIVGPRKRFLTRREGLRLQGMPDTFELPHSRREAFRALGNAVHVGVVEAIAKQFIPAAERGHALRAAAD